MAYLPFAKLLSSNTVQGQSKKFVEKFLKRIFQHYSCTSTWSPSKYSPSAFIHLPQCADHFEKRSSNAATVSAFNSCVNEAWHPARVSKWVGPPEDFLHLVKQEKVAGAKSGKYGGWSAAVIVFRLKNWWTRSEAWAGALSWCGIQEFSLNISGCTRQMRCRKHFRTATYYSLLTVWPQGTYSWSC